MDIIPYQVNVAIHGIDEDMVRGAPTYEEVTARIDQLFRDMVVVSHTHFDRVAIRQASERRSVERPRCRWLDSAMVARRTWKECARSGYGLADVCNRIGYEFQHHNALEDAKAAGHVLMAAMAKTGLDLDGMLQRVLKPIAKPSGPKARPSGPRATVKREGNPDGPFSGEVIVFTGTLSIPRREAADLAASSGCKVTENVTKKSTMLVVGDVDVPKLAGNVKTSKHRKAEKLIVDGVPIRIIRETDFKSLVSAV